MNFSRFRTTVMGYALQCNVGTLMVTTWHCLWSSCGKKIAPMMMHSQGKDFHLLPFPLCSQMCAISRSAPASSFLFYSFIDFPRWDPSSIWTIPVNHHHHEMLLTLSSQVPRLRCGDQILKGLTWKKGDEEDWISMKLEKKVSRMILSLGKRKKTQAASDTNAQKSSVGTIFPPHLRPPRPAQSTIVMACHK